MSEGFHGFVQEADESLSLMRDKWFMSVEEGEGNPFVTLKLNVDAGSLEIISQLMGSLGERAEHYGKQGKSILIDASISPESHEYLWAYLITLNSLLVRRGLKSVICNLHPESSQMLYERGHIQAGKLSLASNVTEGRRQLPQSIETQMQEQSPDAFVIWKESDDQIIVQPKIDLSDASSDIETAMLPLSRLAKGKQIVIDCQNQQLGTMMLIYCQSLLTANATTALIKAETDPDESIELPDVVLANINSKQRGLFAAFGFKTGLLMLTAGEDSK